MATRRTINNNIEAAQRALIAAQDAKEARIIEIRDFLIKRGISVPINHVLTLKFEYAALNGSGDPVFRCKLPDTGIRASLYVPIHSYGMNYGLAFYNSADEYIHWIPNDLADAGTYIEGLNNRCEVANAIRWVLDRISV